MILGFSTSWDGCGRKLCRDHCKENEISGEGRCFSIPKTDCEIEFDIANRSSRKEKCWYFILMTAVFFIIAYIFYLNYTIKEIVTNKWLIIITNSLFNSNNRYREMIPISRKHTNTIIWLADLN